MMPTRLIWRFRAVPDGASFSVPAATLPFGTASDLDVVTTALATLPEGVEVTVRLDGVTFAVSWLRQPSS